MYINFLQYRKMTNLKFNITLILFIFISSSLDFTLAGTFSFVFIWFIKQTKRVYQVKIVNLFKIYIFFTNLLEKRKHIYMIKINY